MNNSNFAIAVAVGVGRYLLFSPLNSSLPASLPRRPANIAYAFACVPAATRDVRLLTGAPTPHGGEHYEPATDQHTIQPTCPMAHGAHTTTRSTARSSVSQDTPFYLELAQALPARYWSWGAAPGAWRWRSGPRRPPSGGTGSVGGDAQQCSGQAGLRGPRRCGERVELVQGSMASFELEPPVRADPRAVPGLHAPAER